VLRLPMDGASTPDAVLQFVEKKLIDPLVAAEV
jgi:hypothetical protein